MSQATDFVIANDTFPNVRADLNAVFSAIGSLSSGASAPSNPFAHMLWMNTGVTPNVLNIRDSSNSSWIEMGEVDQSNLTFNPIYTNIQAGSGTAATPTYTFSNDPNTGIFLSGADELGFSTGGTVRLKLNSSGELIIDNSATPILELKDSASSGNAQTGSMRWKDGGNTTRAEIGYLNTGDTHLTISNGYTSSEVRIRIDGNDVTKFTEDGIETDDIAAAGDVSANNLTVATDTTVNTLTASGTVTHSDATIMNGPLSGAATPVATTNVNCSSGNYFTKIISANTSFSFSSVPQNVYSFIFVIEAIGTRTVTFPNTVQFPSGTAPVQTPSGKDMYVFITDNGGTDWYGAKAMEDLQ